MKTSKFIINFTEHKSAFSILSSFINAHLKKSISGKKLQLLLINPNDYDTFLIDKEITFKELVSIFKKEKRMWGFCIKFQKINNISEIHYWINDKFDVEIEDLCSLITHEMAHTIGINSEEIANKYATVSTVTFLWLLQNFSNEIIKKCNKIKTKNKRKKFEIDIE